MKQFSIGLVLVALLLTACAAPAADNGAADNGTTDEASAESSSEMSTLSFVANGEDFVRQGFVTKDGWQVDFEHLYVTLADVTAYQTDPPYDASSGETPEGESVMVAGPMTVDLAEGDADAEPIVVDTVDAPTGQYNAMGWRIVPAAEGDAAGASVSLMGTAQKDGETVNFVINDATEYAYNCGEYVGDGRKGIVQPDTEADIEATFHFDHIFGDADTPADDALNTGALGFDPLAALATDGALDATLADLEGMLDADAYQTLTDTLATLGHVGEGHCYEATGGYTGHSE